MNNDYNNQQPQQPQYQPPTTPTPQPAQGIATASLVISICALALWLIFSWWTSFFNVIWLILGVVGIICGAVAKKKGFIGGTATAGLVLGIVATVLSSISFITCGVCLCITMGALATELGYGSFF